MKRRGVNRSYPPGSEQFAPRPGASSPSVIPSSHILAWWRVLLHVRSHSPHELRPGKRMPPMPLHRSAIGELGVRARIARGLQELFPTIHREIQKEVVHVPGKELEFPRQFGPQRGPVLLRVGTEVVAMIAIIRGNCAIDGPREFVPERF